MAIPGDAVYRGKITVQNAKVSGSSDHSNFPVLLTEDNFWSELMDAGSESATNGGGGLRFSSDEAGTTQIAHEVVSFVTSATESSRQAEVWVKAPTLAYSTDTDIHVWSSPTASEEAATSTYGSEAVWSDNFAAVYHGDDANDSTSNSNDLTANGGATSGASGKIGDALSFSAASSQYFRKSSISGISADPATISAWFKPNSDTGNGQGIVALETPNTTFSRLTYQDNAGGNPLRNQARNGGVSNVADTSAPAAAAWNHGAATVDSTGGAAVFLNGGSKVTATAASPVLTFSDIFIGAWVSDGGSPLQFFDGEIDEIRVADSVLSDDWIATEYNNQSDPATFAIAGTFQTGGGTAHSLTLSESINASAANSALWAIAANAPESIAAASTQSASADFAASASESAALTSTQSAGLQIAASASESAAISDAESVAIVSGLVAVTVSESISAASTQAANQAAAVSVAESANTASSQSASAAFATAVAEAVAAADIQSISFALESSISEALVTGSAQASLISIDGAVSETISTTSTQSAAAAFSPSVAFSAAVAESVITAAAYQTSYADSIQAVSVESIGIAGETVSFTITVQRKATLATHVATATLN